MRKLLRGVAVGATAALAAIGIALPQTAVADDGPAPLLHYTFDAVNGTVVPDASGNGRDATVYRSGATVADGVLSLSGGTNAAAPYLQFPTEGLVGKNQLTVSAWLSPRSAAGNVAAAFLGAPVASGQSYSTGYWLLNPTNPSGYVKSVLTNSVSAGSPWSTEVGPGATGAATSGIRTPAGMAQYTTVIDGVSGQLGVYVNGTRISQVAIARDVSSFGSSLLGYLGRSTYPDAGWAGDIEDFVVYDGALTQAQVSAAYEGQALDFAIAGVQVPATATQDFPLPASSHGAQISWSSGDAAIVVDGTTARVTRPEAGSPDATVSLTATFTVGQASQQKQFDVVIPADLTAQAKAEADLAAIEINGADNVRTNLSVPTAGALGSTIEWALSDGDHALVRAGVTDSSATIETLRPAAGSDPVEIIATATARNGDAVATRQFTLELQPLPADDADPEAYVWAFFTGEGAGAERVSLAASQGNDALRWNTLNDGEPLFTSDKGTEGLRDPFIIRSPEGDRFFMLATDLKIAGLPGGFTTAQISGSRAIEIWESDDLVNWSEQRHVVVSSEYAGNTWAPEAYWDEELDTYVVFWASNLYDTPNPAERTGVTYNRMIFVTTDDFVTFSEPRIWTDVQRGAGRGMIDSTVAKVGDTYHRFTKDEASMTIRHEQSTDLLATITGSLPGTSGPADRWTLIKEQIASGLPNGEPGKTFHSGEGPSVFPANPGDVNGFDWFLFIDQPSYHGGPNHYIPFGSNDIADGNSWQPLGATLRENLPQNSDGGKPRHGTVIPVTRAEYQSVLEAYAPSIAVEGVAPIVVNTRAGVAPELPGATLTKADASVATVPVVWDEIDPAQYAAPGSFTVAGVAQDASRMPVIATVEVSSALEVSAETRCVAGKVVLAVRVADPKGDGGSAVIASDYGTRSVTVGSGTSVAFSTRQVLLPAGQVTVTDGSGAETAAGYAARTCG